MTEWQAKRAEKRHYWEDQIRRWRESGLTQNSYCRLNKINRHRLVYWRKRLSEGAFLLAGDRGGGEGDPDSSVEVASGRFGS